MFELTVQTEALRSAEYIKKEALKEQPSPFRSVVAHVKDLQSNINLVLPIVKQHMQKAQMKQKWANDRPAQPLELQLGAPLCHLQISGPLATVVGKNVKN